MKEQTMQSKIRRRFVACAALAAAFAALPLFADTWTDPDTGYTWTYQINDDDTAEIYNGNYQAAVSPAPTGHLEIPAELGGMPVTRIGDSAFYGRNGLVGVTIPDSVTSIGELAFYGCRKLASVMMPEDLESIGYGAFGYCDALTAVVFQGDAPEMGNFVFANDSCSIYVPKDSSGWGVDIPGQWQLQDICYSEGEEEVGGYTWSYRVIGETVEIYNYGDIAVYPDPDGDVEIPAELGLHRAYERDDSRRRDEHRGICFLFLHRAYERDDSRRRDEHRRVCVRQLQRSSKRDDPEQREEPRRVCVLRLLRSYERDDRQRREVP